MATGLREYKPVGLCLKIDLMSHPASTLELDKCIYEKWQSSLQVRVLI